MPIFFKDDFTLVAYTTTEADMKKAIIRMPQSQPEVFNLTIRQLFDAEEFKARVSNKVQSEILYVKPNTQSNKISIDDFDLIKVLGRGAFGKVTIKCTIGNAM